MVDIADPIPLSKHHITELTLADIPCHDVQADVSITGKELVDYFDAYPNLPGVLVTKDGQFHSLISRKKFFEHLSKPFGVEVYLKRPVEEILTYLHTQILMFPMDYEISQTVQKALSREPDNIYDPIIVDRNGKYGVVDMYTLLLYMTRTLDNANQIISKQFQIAHQLTEDIGYDNVFHSILEKAHGIIAYEDGFILRNVETGWEITVHDGYLPDEIIQELMQVYKDDLTDFILSQNGHVTHNEDLMFSFVFHERVMNLSISALIVPLHYSEFNLEAILLLRLEHNEDYFDLLDIRESGKRKPMPLIPFQKLDEILFANLESTFSSAIRNTHLITQIQNLAVTDTLTNILNRRGFYAEANRNMLLAQQNGGLLSVLVIDIDHFKSVNDMFGHATGDEVIRAVVGEIKTCLRETDLLGRYGGDEFIILLPNAGQQAAEKVGVRIRQNINAMDLGSTEGSILVTASIGIGVLDADQHDLDALIGKADEALLLAKRIGRNQTVVADKAHFYNNGFIIQSPSSSEESENTAKHTLYETYALNGIDAAALEQTIDDLVEGYVHALELRDKETEGHTQRVAQITVELAAELGVDQKKLVTIQRGALLHDIGKIAIPDQILLKPGPLDKSEWVVMRKHPVYAYDLLTNNTFLRSCLDIPYNHHERWDGQGYPRRLEKNQIPLAARIFSVVDVWDALISDRTYRPAWSREEARAYIAEQSGKQFDPKIVPVFLEMIGKGKI